MISLHALFWIFVALFACIGAIRGWAKELLVSFAVVLGLFIITVLESFIPAMRDLAATQADNTSLFWIRTIILTILVFFGYQGPNISKLAATGKFVRERFQDVLLGMFLGAFNGFLVFGTIWAFLNSANYPFEMIIAPQIGTPAGDAAMRLLEYMPPQILVSPWIYIAVAISFTFVLVVFI